MSKSVDVELFSAKWCGHCNGFVKEWTELEKMAKKDGFVKCTKYEETEPKDKIHFEKNNVSGFPTIHITVDNNRVKYSGVRSANDIMNFINALRENKSQSGGNDDAIYELKYYKYKAKYLKTKDNK